MMGQYPTWFVPLLRGLVYTVGIFAGVFAAGALLGEPWGFVALCLLVAAAIVSETT
jgi:hypothetical protein